VGINQPELVAELKKLRKVGLDTSLLIYHLEDIVPYADFTEIIFASIAEGSLRAVLSTISVTELLVQPFAKGQQDGIATFEQFLLSLPNTDLIPPNYHITREAARLRARYMIRTPDALLISTALREKAEAFLTNDSRLRGIKGEGIAILFLDDFVK
jgi:predicted nucleic acid-binding protein